MAAYAPPRPLLKSDPRDTFDCGSDAINGWFRRHAWANHVSGASRVNVLWDAVNGRVAGFVTLSAAQIEREFLPKPQWRNRPNPIPVTLLGQLAVDRNYQRQGCATSLLIFALQTARHASEQVGSMGVITHPLDDAVRQLYRNWGFEDLPHDPRRAMIVRMDKLRLALKER